jgi:hypothetical protein
MLIAHELWAFQPGDYFARVQVPTLIVVAVPSGTEMPAFIRRRLDEAEALLLNGRVVVMEETIHDIPWHRPRELSALLTEFLSSL